MSLYAGIDIGERHTYSCVLEIKPELSTFHYPARSLGLAETCTWLTDFKDLKGACIDGPPNPNTGALGHRLPPNANLNTNRRLTEFQIGIGGCYSTPNVQPNPGAFNYWMQSSFNLFDHLRQEFEWTIDKGNGNGRLIETHPTYAFKALLGCNQREEHGIERLRTDPQTRLRPKHTSLGHNQRIQLLTTLCNDSGVEVTNDLRQRWNQRIDWVDAAICAFMSYWHQTNHPQLKSPGDPAEGAIFLRIPDEPLTVDEAQVAVQNNAQPARPTGIPQYPLNGAKTSANAIILRLGRNGELSQIDTIDAVNSTEEEEFWFPCVSNAQFKLAANLGMVGGRFFLAWKQRIRLSLNVIDVLQYDEPRPCPADEQNPFMGIQSRIWLRVTLPVEMNTEEFFVNQAGQWTQGFGTGQRALRWAVVPQNGGRGQ